MRTTISTAFVFTFVSFFFNTISGQCTSGVEESDIITIWNSSASRCELTITFPSLDALNAFVATGEDCSTEGSTSTCLQFGNLNSYFFFSRDDNALTLTFTGGASDQSMCETSFRGEVQSQVVCPCEEEITWYLDSDGDGVGGSQSMMDCTQPSGYVASTGDCNDNDEDVQSYGSAPFVVNGVCFSTLAGAQTAAGNTGVIYLENNSTNDPTTSISQDIILVVPQGLSISFSNDVTCYGTIANVGSIGVPNLTIEQGGKYLGCGTLNGNLINNGTIDICGEIPFNEENAELLLNITKDKN